MTYDNIKSHKKPGFHPLFKRYIFRKITGEGQTDAPPQAVLGLIDNENLEENHLGTKKLHLNRKGVTLLAKNLLNFIEGN